MKKILIVDNDRIFLKIFSNFLERKGHQVKTAIDGLHALDILKDDTPDVIFIDLIMPNIDGEMLCRIIRSMKKFKHVYLVILSAISAEEWTDIAKLNANACIAKGIFSNIAQHVLYVLDQPDRAYHRCASGEVLGIDKVFPRGITKELLSVKNHFEVILDGMSDGILKINTEGRILYANSAALALIQLSEKNLIGSDFADLFVEDAHQRVVRILKEQATGTKALTENSPLCLGSYQVSLKIQPLGKGETTSIVILQNVTEAKLAEKALRSAKEYAQNIINSSLDMIISVDNDRKIVAFNHAAEETFGYQKDEVIGKKVDMLYADIDEANTLREKALNVENFVGEVTNVRKNGSTFTALLSFAFMKNKTGEVIGSVGVSRDISNRKTAEKELNKPLYIEN